MRVESSRRGRAARLLLVLFMLALLAGCRLDISVETKVNEDGSGTVVVAVGLDDKALSRAGYPDATFWTQDLKATGWTVSPATRESDGLTWVRASKSFATLEEGERVLAEVNPALKGFTLEEQSGLGKKTWNYKGTLDLTPGIPQLFSDPEVAQVLTDTLGGNLAAIEQEEGKPAAEMVQFRMAVELPGGERKEWRPSLKDTAPTSVEADASKTLPLPILPTDTKGAAGLLLVVGGAIVLVVAMISMRRRFRTRAH